MTKNIYLSSALSCRFGDKRPADSIVDLGSATSALNDIVARLSISCVVVDSLDRLRDEISNLNDGCIAIVSSEIAESISARTAYALVKDSAASGRWEAFTGNYNAKNVYFDHNVTLAGNYESVGNIEITDGTLSARGMSLDALIEKIFKKELSGYITEYPSVTGAVLKGKKNSGNELETASKAYECGTYLTDLQFSGGRLNSGGSYKYGPATTVSISSWTTSASNSVNVTEGSSSNVGRLENVLLGDDGKHKSDPTLSAYKTVTSVRVTETGSYDADTNEAETNIGRTNTSAGFKKVQIPAGSKSTDSGTFSCFRRPFWGTKADGHVIDFAGSVESGQIRGLGQGNDTSACEQNLPTSWEVDGGTKQIVFAVKKDTPNYKKVEVTDVTNPKATFTVAFAKYPGKVQVEGANGYNAAEYDIFAVTLGKAYPGKAKLDISWSNE